MCTHLSFDYRKATQALNFFAHKNNGTISKYKALKLIFFADRFHLRKYGRPMTGDEYYAMQKGPVPSGTKDLAEMADDYRNDVVIAYAGQFISPLLPSKSLKSIKDIDFNELSVSDKDALEFAWINFGKFDDKTIVEKTHEYPEWKKHESALQTGRRVRMDYQDFLIDPPAAIEPCCPLTEKERTIRKSQLNELNRIEAMWN